ncbi:hypothetical protein FQA39_LY02865 [Lamprigera yunnana]|nr:hypothetical protein FQA39_LY02865 [Lamprigera yunnana]
MSSTLRGKHLHAQAREIAFNLYQWIKSQNEDQYTKEIKEKVSRATGHRKQHSIILPSKPMKDIIEDAKEKQQLKQRAKAVKRNFTDCEKNKNIWKKSKTLKQNKRKVIFEDKFSKNERTKRIKKSITPKFDFNETLSENFDNVKLYDDDSNDITLPIVFVDEEKCLICEEFGGTELWLTL